MNLLLKRSLIWIFICIFIGFLSETCALFFMTSLQWVTTLRNHSPLLIYFLPIGGLIIFFLQQMMLKKTNLFPKTSLIFEEIHHSKQKTYFIFFPFIYISTLITHLVGGSSGREGVIVQCSTFLSDAFHRRFNFLSEDRKDFLCCALSAGFGGALNAPLAGICFGVESTHFYFDKETSSKVLFTQNLKKKGKSLLKCSLSVMSASLFSKILTPKNLQHIHFHSIDYPPFSSHLGLVLLFSSIGFGLMARLFIKLMHMLEGTIQTLPKNQKWIPLLGGVLLLFFYFFFSPSLYAGLGLEWISSFFTDTSSIKIPFLKMFATIITLASGFKGGEFIPLLFIGASLGSALSVLFPSALTLLTALGSFAVFSAAAHLPLTCTVLAAETFGIKIIPYAIIIYCIGILVSSDQSIYNTLKRHPIRTLFSKKR